MNIFFVVGGEAVTPPLSGTILPGVTRASVLTLMAEMGIRAEERPVPIEEVLDAHEAGNLTEVFGVGTAATVAPVECIHYRERELRLAVEPQSSISTQVRERLEAIQTGCAPDSHGWLMRL